MAEVPPEYFSQSGYLRPIGDCQKTPERRAQSVPGASKYRFPQFIFRHRPEKSRLYTNVFGERGQRFSGFRSEIVH